MALSSSLPSWGSADLATWPNHFSMQSLPPHQPSIAPSFQVLFTFPKGKLKSPTCRAQPDVAQRGAARALVPRAAGSIPSPKLGAKRGSPPPDGERQLLPQPGPQGSPIPCGRSAALRSSAHLCLRCLQEVHHLPLAGVIQRRVAHLVLLQGVGTCWQREREEVREPWGRGRTVRLLCASPVPTSALSTQGQCQGLKGKTTLFAGITLGMRSQSSPEIELLWGAARGLAES